MIKFFTAIIIVFSTNAAVAQIQMNTPFEGKILVYTGEGLSIPHTSNSRIVSSEGLTIHEDSTGYLIHYGEKKNLLIIGTKLEDGSELQQCFQLEFIRRPDPKIRLNCQTYDSFNEIKLHKDSIEKLKYFYLSYSYEEDAVADWTAVSTRIYYPGLKGAPPTFQNDSVFPRYIIDSLLTLGDTIPFSMTSTVRMKDGITRQLGASFKLILLDGIDYERHIDPKYNYKHYSDTVYLTKEQLLNSEKLQINNPGHLYLALPRTDEDYEFNFKVGHCTMGFGEEYTTIEKGIGYFIEDAHNASDRYFLSIKRGELFHSIEVIISSIPPK